MPLLWFSLAFLGGVVLGSMVGLGAGAWLAAGAGLVLLAFVARRLLVRRELAGAWSRLWAARPVSPALIGLVLCLGAARYAGAQPAMTPAFIVWYAGTGVEMSVVGVVTSPPDERDAFTLLRVAAERVRPRDSVFHTEVSGLLLARLPTGGGWAYGDRVVLDGLLQVPPDEEEFSYRDYLARQGVYAYLPEGRGALLERDRGHPVLHALYRLRARALETIYLLFPDPDASLLAGILLGIETGIPASVQEAFKDTGTTHIIAISGFNITILAGLFAAGFGRLLGPRWGALAAVLGIGLYTVLVGADAAVVRAAIMGGLSVFARQLGRRQAALNSLAFTAAVMAAFNPQLPWDIGFQLSFAATLGLVLYADPLAEAFVRGASRFIPQERARQLAGPAGEYFLFTLAAQLTTLPVTVYHFRRLSLSSLLANPAILPVQPAVMILGGLAVLAGMVWLPLGRLAAGLAWPAVVYSIRVVEAFARIKGGVLFLGRVGLPAVACFYTLLLAWTFAGEPQKARVRRALPDLGAASAKAWPALAGLAILTVLAWRAALQAPDGLLHLTVLPVSGPASTGDAVLIQTPEGRYVLVDGGPRASLLSDALGRRLPWGDRRLDWLVVAAPFEGQVGALPSALARFPPGRVLWAGPERGSRPARVLTQALAEARIPLQPAEAGQRLDLGDGAELKVLAVGTRGAVLLLEHGSFRALLPAGLDFELLEALQAWSPPEPVTALLLAEGGYAPLNPPAWIAALQPQVVLLSVAGEDFQGLPSPETLAALEGYELLRTDRQGWIDLATDGREMWVEVERR